jgi:hypothetical protein
MIGFRAAKQRYDDDSDEDDDLPPIIPFEDLSPELQLEVLRTRRFIKMVGWVSIGAIAFLIILTIVAVVIKTAS